MPKRRKRNIDGSWKPNKNEDENEEELGSRDSPIFLRKRTIFFNLKNSNNQQVNNENESLCEYCGQLLEANIEKIEEHLNFCKKIYFQNKKNKRTIDDRDIDIIIKLNNENNKNTKEHLNKNNQIYEQGFITELFENFEKEKQQNKSKKNDNYNHSLLFFLKKIFSFNWFFSSQKNNNNQNNNNNNNNNLSDYYETNIINSINNSTNIEEELLYYRRFTIPYNELIIKEKLSSGAFGDVYKCEWRGSVVALKLFKYKNSNYTALPMFRKEVAILAKLRHPQIVLFMGHVTTPNTVGIVMEYADMGSLYDLLHKKNIKFEPQLLYKIAQQIALGINYLHLNQPQIIHRDLKQIF